MAAEFGEEFVAVVAEDGGALVGVDSGANECDGVAVGDGLGAFEVKEGAALDLAAAEGDLVVAAFVEGLADAGEEGAAGADGIPGGDDDRKDAN